MTSSEFPPEGQFTVNEQGANGVGGFVPYGLKLKYGFFVDQEGVRSDPALMNCPEHAVAVASLENAPRPPYAGSPGANAEAGQI